MSNEKQTFEENDIGEHAMEKRRESPTHQEELN